MTFSRAALFVIGVHDVPGHLLDVGVGEHFVLGLGVIDPAAAGFDVHGAELPALGDVLKASLKAAFLFLVADREPILDEVDSGAHQHPFELGTTLQEFDVFGFRAEAHDALHAGAVVPAAVEEHDLSGGGKM